MKKKLVAIIVCTAVFIPSQQLMAIPFGNQYHIHNRSHVNEPKLNEYSVHADAVTDVSKPRYCRFTLLNTYHKNNRYIIQPYPFSNQLPKLGNWMSAPSKQNGKADLVPAHWLNDQSADGRYIIEPINYLFVVYSDSKLSAIQKLKHKLMQAGFSIRWSGAKYHSENYHAYVNDQQLNQLKNKHHIFLTFSNNFWLDQNDHFRVMGAYHTKINRKNAYLFLSSVSEESNWDLKKNTGHYFVSFGNARNNLATALIQKNLKTYYVIANNMLSTQSETTEDHDGEIFVTII